MARFYEPTKQQLREFRKWVKKRPRPIRELIAQRSFNPWTLYRMKDSGHRVSIVSFIEPEGQPDKHEPGCPAAVHDCGHTHTYEGVSVTVSVDGRFNAVGFERRVHTDPDNLVECDLPGPLEPVGSADLTPAEAALPEPIRTSILISRRDTLRPFGMTNPEVN